MAVGDVYRLSVEGVSGATLEQLVCTFHYRQDTPEVLPNVGADLVAAWRAAAQPSFLPTFSASAGINRFTVRSVLGAAFVYEQSVALTTGTLTGDDLPPQVSGLISWRTGLPGRSFRGRTYLWLGTEGIQTQGILTSAYVTDMNQFASNALTVQDGALTGSYTLGVWSAKLSVFTPITQWIARDTLATQRRRRVGVGS